MTTLREQLIENIKVKNKAEAWKKAEEEKADNLAKEQALAWLKTQGISEEEFDIKLNCQSYWKVNDKVEVVAYLAPKGFHNTNYSGYIVHENPFIRILEGLPEDEAAVRVLLANLTNPDKWEKFEEEKQKQEIDKAIEEAQQEQAPPSTAEQLESLIKKIVYETMNQGAE